MVSQKSILNLEGASGQYQIRIHGLFESAHYLYHYYKDGSDEELHGHTWEAEVFFNKNTLENGISVDFLHVRSVFDELIERLDHTCINEIEPFNKYNPTAENIARYVYQHLNLHTPKEAYIHSIRIWEGPKNWATFYPKCAKENSGP